MEASGLLTTPLLSDFLERKAKGLERKPDARAVSDELGDSARLGARCGELPPSYEADLLDG